MKTDLQILGTLLTAAERRRILCRLTIPLVLVLLLSAGGSLSAAVPAAMGGTQFFAPVMGKLRTAPIPVYLPGWLPNYRAGLAQPIVGPYVTNSGKRGYYAYVQAKGEYGRGFVAGITGVPGIQRVEGSILQTLILPVVGRAYLHSPPQGDCNATPDCGVDGITFYAGGNTYDIPLPRKASGRPFKLSVLLHEARTLVRVH